MSNINKWIGVDFDGTLAEYTHGPLLRGNAPKAIPPMVQRVRVWLEQGRTVKIFTGRVADVYPFQVKTNHIVIQSFCLQHFGITLPITCVKDQNMEELWDDRAVRVERNTGRIISCEH